MIWLKTKNKGFTLIELLVVISVIALLSSIVFTSLNSARQKARNVARLSAVRTLVNAFNLSLSDSGSLPISGWACVGLTCYDTWAQYPANPTLDAFLAPSCITSSTYPFFLASCSRFTRMGPKTSRYVATNRFFASP